MQNLNENVKKIEQYNSDKYNLEERTYLFAQQVRTLVKVVRRDAAGYEDSKQLVRSSGSVAANYIEASESLSKKDFIHRMKICRKEAKESRLWLRLLDMNSPTHESNRTTLVQEAWELTLIFGSIVNKK